MVFGPINRITGLMLSRRTGQLTADGNKRGSSIRESK